MRSARGRKVALSCRIFGPAPRAIATLTLSPPLGSSYLRRVASEASPIDLNLVRNRRVAGELERLAAAQRVHDRIQARLREARRLEFERASRSGVSVEQIAEITSVSVETVRTALTR
jgi:DNA-directed RNA polymerase specialized sigma24 family protein